MPVIEFHDTHLLRGGAEVLRGISFAVQHGQHTAILGPNGSGKSSMLSLITRERYPVATESGKPSMTIMGQDTWDIFELRTQLGIVTHEIERFFTATGTVTCSDVVLSGFFASKGVGVHHAVSEAMRQRAHHALEAVDALHLEDREVATLSTGETRRVLIARALVNEPRALLLDEPTEGLDLVSRRNFLESLRHIARMGTTLMLITHHVEEILPEINHIVLLKEGRVFRHGHKAEMLSSSVLSALFDATVVVHRHGEYYSAAVDAHAPRL